LLLSLYASHFQATNFATGAKEGKISALEVELANARRSQDRNGGVGGGSGGVVGGGKGGRAGNLLMKADLDMDVHADVSYTTGVDDPPTPQPDLFDNRYVIAVTGVRLPAMYEVPKTLAAPGADFSAIITEVLLRKDM
jgi:hypothetical protein